MNEKTFARSSLRFENKMYLVIDFLSISALLQVKCIERYQTLKKRGMRLY